MPVDFYLEIHGISGESQDSLHKDCIEVMSWNWCVSQSGTTHMGTGGGAGKASFQDLSLTKSADLASTALLQYCTTGKHIPSATLHCYKAAGDSRVKYLEVQLERIVVSSYCTGGVDGAQLQTENISLNFGKFKIIYTQQMADGSAGKSPDFGWDIAAHEAS